MYIDLKTKEEILKKYHKGIKKIFKNYKSLLIKRNNEKYLKNEALNNPYLNNIDGVGLDKIQKEVVLSKEENTLVIAGAGSGKTLTILAKVIYLIKNGISPKEILCLSFTNASADSLKKRLKKNNIDLKVLTFHKLAMQILLKNGYRFAISDDSVLAQIIFEKLNIDRVRKIIDLKFITVDNYENFCADSDVAPLQEIIFKKSPYYAEIEKTIMSFINLFKNRGYKLEEFDRFITENKREKNKYIRDRNEKYLRLIKEIYEKYEGYLMINKKIDFHDMINKATECVLKNGAGNYKYIIIDEYQDTSLSKCQLIKAIKESTKAKVMAVGDDWQSIYKFAGTDLDVFTDFNKYFPYTKTYKLTNTYRNSNELLKIMNRFIMKNNYQIPKNLTSNKHLENPILIYYYEDNQQEVLDSILRKMNKPYFILGRNNSNIDLVDKKYQKKFMTVHKSKGLETDVAIIVNLEDSPQGFPNKTINDAVLKYVTSEEMFPYEEERRLFYVALTRTKSYNILLVNKNNPSMFVKEIMDGG